MKISELFKSQSFSDSVKPLNSEEQSHAEKQKQATEDVQKGEDQVSISPLARQFAQISKLLAEDAAAGKVRLAELKDQVGKGSYSVSQTDVAQAISAFARDSQI